MTDKPGKDAPKLETDSCGRSACPIRQFVCDCTKARALIRVSGRPSGRLAARYSPQLSNKQVARNDWLNCSQEARIEPIKLADHYS